MTVHPAASATLRVAGDGPIRVLQVTDWHSDKEAAAAAQTHADVRTLVAQTQPDLLAVTGDIWCADDERVQHARSHMDADLEIIESLDVPWAFVPGNHDYFPDRAWLHNRFAQPPKRDRTAWRWTGQFCGGNCRRRCHPPLGVIFRQFRTGVEPAGGYCPLSKAG